MKTKRIFSFLIFIIILSTLSLAHEGEDSAAVKDTFTVVDGDTIAINGEDYEGKIESAEAEDEVEDTASGSFEPTLEGIFTEHIHNKIIHFPIAFAVGAFILTLIGFKDNRYETGIKWLVVLAGLAGIIAYFSGAAQEEAFEGSAKEWVVEIHETIGIAAIVVIWIWAFFLYVKSLKKFAWILGAAVTLLVLIAGTYGGMLAHG